MALNQQLRLNSTEEDCKESESFSDYDPAIRAMGFRLATLFLLLACVHGLRTSHPVRLQRHVSSVAPMQASSPQSDQDPSSKLMDAAKYYSGLVNDPLVDLQLNEEQAKRDNLTPNLRLAAIWTVILAVLFQAFLEANKDIQPFVSSS